MTLQIASASVLGRDHVGPGKNNQDRRVAAVLRSLGAPSYIPVHAEAGLVHRHVVRVVDAAVHGDPEFESYWRS